jgi:hypothetical protein
VPTAQSKRAMGVWENHGQYSRLKFCLRFSLPGHEFTIENLIAAQFHNLSGTASFSLDTESQLQKQGVSHIYVKELKNLACFLVFRH